MKLYLYKNFNNSSLLLKEAGAGRRTAHFHDSPPAIEGADAPYGRKVRQPLKGCALTKIGFANASIPSPFPTQNEPPIEGSLILPKFVPKTKGFRFGAMILDEERVFGESRRWERTLVRDQWRLSPKRSYSPKAFAKSRAESRAAMISSMCSMPIDSLIRSGASPAALCASSPSCECDVLAG